MFDPSSIGKEFDCDVNAIGWQSLLYFCIHLTEAIITFSFRQSQPLENQHRLRYYHRQKFKLADKDCNQLGLGPIREWAYYRYRHLITDTLTSLRYCYYTQYSVLYLYNVSFIRVRYFIVSSQLLPSLIVSVIIIITV